jgi:ABC-type transport system involved in cytochrome bd biosynthesis fused ATPase/permease subunit
MINFNLIEKFLFPKIIFFYLRIFFFVINGLLELIGISLLLVFIKIISTEDSSINFFIFTIEESNFSNIINVCLIVIIFYALKNIYNFWLITSQHKILKKSQLNLSKKIYYGYIQSKLDKIININSKKIIQDINIETEKLFYEYFQSFLTLITEVIIIFIILMFFLYNEPLISIYLVLLSIIIYFLASKIFFKKSSLMGMNRIEGFEKLSSIVNASIGLFKELKVMNKMSVFSKLFDKNLKSYVNSKYFDNITSELPKIFIELFVVTLIVTVVIILISVKGNVDNMLLTLSMFAIGSIRIMPSINRVAVANHNIKFYGETISQLLFDTEYFDYTKEKKSKKSKNSIKNSIKFKNVNYGVLNKKIIENLNLQISFKDKILVVGKSGSGKTTFLKILAGLLPINSGIIYTGKKINKNFLRFKEPISFLSQENFIVDKKSIFYNICLKDKEDAKDRDLIQFQKVVEIANLQDLLTKLRLKDDTILHENGSNISGGEKQRICLARSLFSNNQFIIMDEPFSSIDKQNSNEIFKKVLKETENKTLILSNHKKIDLKKFNKIFFFEESQLIKIKKIK